MHPYRDDLSKGTATLLERATDRAVRAIRHPISSTAYAAGIVRGLAAASLRAASELGTPGPDRPAPQPGSLRVVPTQRAAPRQAQGDVPRPKATSRRSAHGGPADDAEIDAWIDEAMARGHAADGGPALEQPGTAPLLDPGTAKAVRSESAMLRRAAERDPE